VAGLERPYPSSKIDVEFRGEAAHAGGEPQNGRNAVQAMLTAITNLYGLSRHGDGVTRVNVGHVEAPNAQNIIASTARMRHELRSDKDQIREFLAERASTVVENAAAMHGVTADEAVYGAAPTFEADGELVTSIAGAASDTAADEVRHTGRMAASEDASHLINRVQETGGQATHLGIGASNVAGHHDPRFDFDEEALDIGVDVLTEAIQRLG